MHMSGLPVWECNLVEIGGFSLHLSSSSTVVAARQQELSYSYPVVHHEAVVSPRGLWQHRGEESAVVMIHV